jgi:Family of unknown function (DUF6338)
MTDLESPGGADGSAEQWLTKLVILLPGFAALGLARYLGACGDLGDLELTLFSLGLSLIIVVSASLVYAAVARLKHRYLHSQLRLPPRRFMPPLNAVFVSLVLAMSISIGLMLAMMYDSDTILRVVRSGPDHRLTKRSSTNTLPFLLTLNQHYKFKEADQRKHETQAYLEVVLNTNERFAGMPLFFGIDKEPADIYLSRACTIENGDAKAIEGPGVFIPEKEIRFVLFLDRTPNKCNCLWSAREGTACAQSGS